MFSHSRSIVSITATALVVLLGSPQTARSAVSASDRQFMKEAAQGGMAEVAQGRLVAQRGVSEGVRRFGDRMVEDHSKANDELRRLAARKSVILPATMGPKHRRFQNRLMHLSGASFDQAYIKHMVDDHVEDVAAFRREARTAHDADLRHWAAKTLPTLESHLRMARDVRREVYGRRRMMRRAR
jgi:putative membrane protein